MDENELFSELVKTRDAIDNGIAGVGPKRSMMIRNNIRNAIQIAEQPDHLPDVRDRVVYAYLISLMAVMIIEAAAFAAINSLRADTKIDFFLYVLFATILAFGVISVKSNELIDKIMRSGNPIIKKIFIPQKN